MIKRFLYYLLSLDPLNQRLVHAIKVTIIFIVSSIIALIWRKPESFWIVITATLLPDISLSIPEKQKKYMLLITGVGIALIMLFLSNLSEIKAYQLVTLFITTTIGIGFIYFGEKYFGVGLYFAIFSAIALTKNFSSIESLNIFFNVLTGTLVSTILYTSFPVDLSLFSARMNIRKSLKDISKLFLSYDSVDDNNFAALREESWQTLHTPISLLPEISAPKERKLLTEKYVDCAWNIRRLLVLLRSLKAQYPSCVPLVANYCNILGEHFAKMILNQKYESDEFSFEFLEDVSPLIKKILQDITINYMNICKIISHGKYNDT